MRIAAVPALVALMVLLGGQAPVATPTEHRRPADNTFLTGPEWFLVFSPGEYAAYLPLHPPSRFPFWGHILQFWQGYAAVTRADRVPHPNYGYHLMIVVIGISTTAEYGLKSLYETTAGRFSEAVSGAHDGAPDTPEDRLAARTAADYVAFIKVQPWYEFDFLTPLRAVWSETGWWGAHPLRKWERKYMLTSEYIAKAGYGWLLGKATRASYDRPIERTYVVLHGIKGAFPKDTLEVARNADSAALLLPRYQAFTTNAAAMAIAGADFDEIAGNRDAIMVSIVTGKAFTPPEGGTLLYRQDILTRRGLARFVLSYPVVELGAVLRSLNQAGIQAEHVYDY